MNMKMLFLGGTVENDYRPEFVATLHNKGVPKEKIFNPVVEDWNESARQLEDELKADPAVLMLYHLAGNKEGLLLSIYSLFEALTGLYDHPQRTVVVFDYEGLVPEAAIRLRKICSDLRARFPNAPLFESLRETEDWLLARLV